MIANLIFSHTQPQRVEGAVQHVEVRVDDAGHDGAPARVDDARGGALPAVSARIRAAADEDDALALQGDGLGGRLGRVGGEDVGVGNDQISGLGHGYLSWRFIRRNIL